MEDKEKPLRLHKIPWDALQFNEQTGKAERKSGEAPVINQSQRHMVVADVEGTKVPFYRSTGMGGKTETEAGKWYPMMGIGEEGWINKTHGADLARYYDSPELAKIGAHLDKHVGDPTQAKWVGDIPSVSGTSGRHKEFINEVFKHRPADNRTPGVVELVNENIEHIKQKIAGKF